LLHYPNAKNTGGYASLSIFFNDSPKSVVIPVSSSYQLIELKGTAPQASSGFVSIYSEGNLTVDQCSLTTGDVAPPPPPPPSGDNLLENGGFETLNANSKPVNWNKGCGGSYDRVVGRSGNGLSLTGGACVDQSLSGSDLSTLANKQYTYSCYAKNTGGYASMSIFFDDVPVATVIPQSNSFQLVEVTGTAPSASTGFVSIYSEAGLVIDDCSVTVADAQPVPCVDPVNFVETVIEDQARRALENLDSLPVLSLTRPLTCADLARIEALNLERLTELTGRPISLEDLKLFPNLKGLDLKQNQLTDISVLSNLTQLGGLDLRSNNISDISSLAGLTNLNTLYLNNNQITDISALSDMSQLRKLILGFNSIEDISSLQGLTDLEELSIPGNKVKSLSPLVNNAGVGAGDFIILGGNCLNDLQDASDVATLESRGVTVSFGPQETCN